MQFDQAVDKGVGIIARSEPDDIIRIIRSLPQHCGGLGLPRHHSPKSDEACGQTRQKVLAFLQDFSHLRGDLKDKMTPWEDLPDREEFY